jgi:hypothetical protein
LIVGSSNERVLRSSSRLAAAASRRTRRSRVTEPN